MKWTEKFGLEIKLQEFILIIYWAFRSFAQLLQANAVKVHWLGHKNFQILSN
jgi:hypothetical protein